MDMASKICMSSYCLYYLICTVVINALNEDIYVNSSKLITLWMVTVVSSMVLGLLMCAMIEGVAYRWLCFAIFGAV